MWNPKIGDIIQEPTGAVLNVKTNATMMQIVVPLNVVMVIAVGGKLENVATFTLMNPMMSSR